MVLTKFMTPWHLLLVPVLALATFGTRDRLIHLGWATIFSILPILFIQKRLASGSKSFRIPVREFFLPPELPKAYSTLTVFFVLFLGSWIPDIDWLIHSHRNPLTHSALPWLWALRFQNIKLGNQDWSKRLTVLFGYALASHLATDIIPGGNVVWLPPKIDMPFLAVNALVTFVWAFSIHRDLAKRAYSSPTE